MTSITFIDKQYAGLIQRSRNLIMGLMRPEEPAATWTVDLAPGTDSDASDLRWSAGDHDAARPQHRQCCLVQRRWIAGATHHDGIVVTCPVATNRFEARVQHLAPDQPERSEERRVGKEGRPAGAACE